MQVQSASDPPKKLALGERAVQADGNEYNLFQLKEAGQPVEPVYATEGTPLVVGPNGIFKNAPNPNAARLFQNYCFSAECQQLVIDVGGLRSEHPQTKEKPGRKPLKDIKTMKEDRRRRRKGGRRDQDALQQAVQGLRTARAMRKAEHSPDATSSRARRRSPSARCSPSRCGRRRRRPRRSRRR